MNANKCEIIKLIEQGESLSVEFKSDRHCLPDRDLVAAVVSLANTDGGDLLLGVEDDGTITGIHKKHENLSGLPALIANKTNPSISRPGLPPSSRSRWCSIISIRMEV